jgi:protein MYSM1
VNAHSHMAHTEIIGLLGGLIKDNLLHIQHTFPCRSTGTEIQCEMDPVSEIEARQVFSELGVNVVGWYHSHPTFEPNPSIRDMENQANYQALFADASGNTPFVGLIMNPYPNDSTQMSQYTFFSVFNEDELLPIQSQVTMTSDESDVEDLKERILMLLDSYSRDPQ